MKRILSLFLSLMLMAALFTGCSNSSNSDESNIPSTVENTESESTNADKVSVVATIFPQYDFIREIAGDNVELTMLLPPGAESHSFEPTPRDIITIQNCDMFIYVGGESDSWIEEILESMDTSNMEIVSLIDLVDTVEEEIVEGMEDDHGHSHGDEDFEDSDVKDRPLSDWAGEWQSVYPYLLDGSLDEFLEHKAEDDDDDTKDVEYYRNYYDNSYKTDADKTVIEGDSITYYVGGVANEVKYEYKGFKILLNKSEEKRVRYLFEAVGETDGAPRYIQLSDHIIEPGQEVEHWHLYQSNESHEALFDEWSHWPTYYSADLDAEGILDELIGHDHGEEPELDEHVWTSPKNAIKIVQALSDKLCSLDSTNAAVYEGNTTAYIDKLTDLDNAFSTAVSEGSRKTLVFGDRFPFRYFADAYDLEYFAAFPGCSTETEASAATVAFLMDKVKAENIPVVFHIELSNENMADTICEETGASKMLLHSCHNLTKDEFEGGVTYLDLMTQNVESLKEALK